MYHIHIPTKSSIYSDSLHEPRPDHNQDICGDFYQYRL